MRLRAQAGREISGRWMSSTWMPARRDGGELAEESFIQTVDVVEEVGLTVFVRNGRLIDDMHGDGLREVDLPGPRAHTHRRKDFGLCPAGTILQEPGGEVGGPLQTNASVAEIPSGVSEQGFRRRIVEIDVVGVGEYEFQAAECVFRAGALADLKLAATQGGEDRAGYRAA